MFKEQSQAKLQDSLEISLEKASTISKGNCVSKDEFQYISYGLEKNIKSIFQRRKMILPEYSYTIFTEKLIKRITHLVGCNFKRPSQRTIKTAIDRAINNLNIIEKSFIDCLHSDCVTFIKKKKEIEESAKNLYITNYSNKDSKGFINRQIRDIVFECIFVEFSIELSQYEAEQILSTIGIKNQKSSWYKWGNESKNNVTSQKHTKRLLARFEVLKNVNPHSNYPKVEMISFTPQEALEKIDEIASHISDQKFKNSLLFSISEIKNIYDF